MEERERILPPYEWVTPARLRVAKKTLKKGESLKKAAQVSGVFASSLDRALWYNLGGEHTGEREPMFD